MTHTRSRALSDSSRASMAARVAGSLVAIFAVLSVGHPSAAFQPNTMRVGTLEIHPSLSAEMVCNDNISLTNDEQADVIFKEVPAISLQCGRTYVPVQGPRIANPHGLSLDFLLDFYLTRVVPLGERGYLGSGKPNIGVGKPMESAILSGLRFRKFSVALEYRPEIIHLVNHPEFNSIDHEVTLSGDVRIPGGVYVRLDNAFVSSTAVNSYRKEIADFTTVQRSEGIGFHTNLLSLTVGYNFYADYLLFLTYTNYLFFLRGFDAGQVLPGAEFPPLLDLELEGVNSGTLGLNLQTVGIYFATILKRKTTVSLGYVWGRLQGNLEDFGLETRLLGDLVPVTVRIREDPRNANLQELRFGFQRALTSVQSVFGWPIPKTVLEGSFSYQWRDFDPSEIELNALGQPVLVVPFPREPFREFFVDLRLISQVRSRTLLTGRFSRYPREAVGGSGNVSTDWEGSLALSQGIREKFDLDMTGLVRRSDHADPSATQASTWNFEAGASLAYRIQSWLQVGMAYQFLAREADVDYNAYQSHRIRFRVLVFF